MPKVKLEWEDSGWYQVGEHWCRDVGIFHIELAESTITDQGFGEEINIDEAFIMDGGTLEMVIHSDYKPLEDMKSDIDDFVERLKKPHLEIALKALE